MMKILVCGGRYFGDLASLKGNREHSLWEEKEKEYQFILDTLNKLSLDWPKTPKDEYGNWLPNVHIIAGGAKGVDSVAIDWAVVNWQSFTEVKAEWDKYGKRAGYLRNLEMAKMKPDLCVAFPGGPGTKMMIEMCVRFKIPIKQIEYT